MDDIALAKSYVVGFIRQEIKQRHLSQVAAARLLKIDQPGVSRLASFSFPRLLNLVLLLGHDVVISLINPNLTKQRRGPGCVRVVIEGEEDA